MSQKVIDIIETECESTIIDFKQEQYQLGNNYNKHELLKDISAMANHVSDEDKYIIIGVVEREGFADKFISILDFIDSAKYAEYVNKYIEPEMNFEYRKFDYKGYKLAYFRIFSNNNRPYLFKNEVINAKDGSKIEFRKGDGFTRVGTSTRRLLRADYDRIYSEKNISIDRKLDVDVKPYIGLVENHNLEEYGMKYIDVTIENISNRSIEVDIEMKILLNRNALVISAYDLQKMKHDEKLKKINSDNLNSFIYRPEMIIPPLPPLYVHTKHENECMYAVISAPRGQKTALIIPQHDKTFNIFDQQIVIAYIKHQTSINLSIILRSDDFTEGILEKSFELPVEPNMHQK